MINKVLAKLLIEESLKTGADFSELYIEDSINGNVVLDNGIIETVGYARSRGVGVRLLKGTRSVYGYTNEINKKNLLSLVNKLRSAFNDSPCTTAKEFVNKKIKNISKIHNSFFETPTEEKIKLLQIGHETMKNFSPLIQRTTCGLAASKKKVEMYNSNGLHFKDEKERIRLIYEAIANEGDKHETGFEGPGACDGLDFIKNIDLKALAYEVASDAVEALHAKECPSGKMSVIIGNGFGGVLFHEACGHSLEASAVSRNLSVFSNRLGEQIASTIVSAYDDGTIPNAWGSNNVDDEGNLTENTCLIKNGILNNYLIDDFNGRRMNQKGNGACRRQNYKYEPTSRMSNTYIANGTTPVEDIIKNTKLGLYAKKLNGGQVNPVNGEFQFSVGVGYIVRDGKICERVRGATLIGKGEEVLKNIDMIGNDLKLAQGVCGAASGNIPTNVGQPTIRVQNILVGGNGGKLQ